MRYLRATSERHNQRKERSVNAAPDQIGDGWIRDFVEEFATLDTAKWGRYDSEGNQAGQLSNQQRENCTVENGNMRLRTWKNSAGKWTSAGVSGNPGFAGTMGKWTIRAKFDDAYGIGYAFLLYPRGGAWPPEIDFAEGTCGGPRILCTQHWGTSSTDHQSTNQEILGVDMTQWHTYGCILLADRVEYTLDGVTVKTTMHPAPTMPMWIGFQTGAKDPNAVGASGEVVGSQTPADSSIYIDWVCHWHK